MLDSRRSRAFILVVLISLLTGLFVWYGTLTPNPRLGEYPDETDLATEYSQYVTENVVVSGEVIATDPVMIASRNGNDRVVFTVTNLEFSVQQGDILRVYGIAGPNRTIHAVNAFRVPKHRLWYTYGISFLAGLWVLARLIRDWRFEPRTGSISPRIHDSARPRGTASSSRKEFDA